MNKEALTGMLNTGIRKTQTIKATWLTTILAEAYEECQNEEQLSALNEEIAAFCSHVRNSLEKDGAALRNALNTKPISK